MIDQKPQHVASAVCRNVTDVWQVKGPPIRDRPGAVIHQMLESHSTDGIEGTPNQMKLQPHPLENMAKPEQVNSRYDEAPCHLARIGRQVPATKRQKPEVSDERIGIQALQRMKTNPSSTCPHHLRGLDTGIVSGPASRRLGENVIRNPKNDDWQSNEKGVVGGCNRRAEEKEEKQLRKVESRSMPDIETPQEKEEGSRPSPSPLSVAEGVAEGGGLHPRGWVLPQGTR